MSDTKANHSSAVTVSGGDYTYPTNPEELSGDWLADTIAKVNPGLKVLGATQTRIIWGTATKVFFDLQFRRQGETETRQQSICVKGAFDERMRNYYDLSVLYTTEAAFYRDIAPEVDIVRPHIWLAIENRSEGIVAMDDMGSKGAVFVDASGTLTLDQCWQVLDSIAVLHAKTWGWKAGRLPWISLGSGAQRGGNTAMMEGDRFAALTGRSEVSPFLPPELSDRDTVLAALRRMWMDDDASDEICLSHGDMHLGQTYIGIDGRLGILDWQSCALMPWAKDIAYFIASALPVDERRVHERDLLEHYLCALARNGGPVLDRDAAWRSYRKQMLAGMVWPVVTENMQSMAAISTLSQRYLTAMSDLQTLAAFSD